MKQIKSSIEMNKTILILMLTLTSMSNKANAQYTKLLDFASVSTGKAPIGSLFSDGTFLYGTTSRGGTKDFGALFKIMPDGTNFTKLLDFDFGSLGNYPNGSLISDGISLFGMASFGGTSNFGTLFKVLPNGTGFTKLYEFGGKPDGGYPNGSLIAVDSFLYGMTPASGTNDKGIIFKIKRNETSIVKLFDFDGISSGSTPQGDLLSDGTFLYGMTYIGGTKDSGVIFKIKLDGTGFVKLLDFTGTSNGSNPYGSLISDGTYLYGMTTSGGANQFGTIFKISKDGMGYTKLLDFAGATNGKIPYGSLTYDGTYLYGMTSQGGTYDMGTIFKIMPNGTGYVKLLDFNGTTNGDLPMGSLISKGAFLYGMTTNGGANNQGVMFKISKYSLDVQSILEKQPIVISYLKSNEIINIEMCNYNNTFTEIIDAQGNVLNKVYLHSKTTSLDISPFSKGIYFVKVQNAEGTKVEKFIKD